MIMQDDAPDSRDAEENDHDPDAKAAQAARSFLKLIEDAVSFKGKPDTISRKLSESAYQDACDAPTERAELDLLLDAVDLDPKNAAALLDLKDFFDLTLDEDLLATRAIAALAEQRLGKKAFTDSAGLFWHFLETRPYMRARAELASLYLEADRPDLAVEIWEELIALNPGDAQGNRFALIATDLVLNRPEPALRLLEAFADNEGEKAFNAWGLALARLLLRDEPAAAAALAEARARNGFIEAYLLGHRNPPKELPERCEPGSREEAEILADTLQQAWGAHEDAVRWLVRQPKTKR